MRKAIVIVVALLVAGGALYLWKGKKAAPGDGAPKIRLEEARRGEIVQAVESSGTVTSNLDVEIKCKASGQIISLPYDESDAVEKGALVLKLDPIDENRNVKKAEVTLSQARARLEKSRRSLMIAERELGTSRGRAEAGLAAAKAKADDAAAKEERVRELLDRKLAGQEEYDTARTATAQARAELERARITVEELTTQEASLELNRQDVKVARADVEGGEINLSIARRRLEETKVYAPISGTITQRMVQEGQIISSATSNVGGGTTVMTISDLSRLYVISTVDESDIGNVRRGQEVEITADAFPGRPFRGVVDRIAPKGRNVQNVVTFEVRIEVLRPGAGGAKPEGGRPGGKRPDSGGKPGGGFDREAFGRKTKDAGGGEAALKPEMTANVEIIIARKEDALMIPVEAVSRAQGNLTVEVDAGEGKTEMREVETGIDDGTSIEVTRGLKEGEKVVVKEEVVDSEWSRGGRRPMMMGGSPGGRVRGRR